jgi:hypothetical protein
MYLKRNTKFLLDRWAWSLLRPLRPLNDIVFHSNERSVKSLRKVDLKKKWLKFWLCAFSPKVKEFDTYDNLVVFQQRCSCPSPHRPLQPKSNIRRCQFFTHQRHPQYQLRAATKLPPANWATAAVWSALQNQWHRS